MILVFGGTTEGRKAVKELEEAGNPYFYSTKGAEQEITLKHGIRLSGVMDETTLIAFCQENHIRLLIDAAHPFATQLHLTVASVAGKMNIPAVRFERNYPSHDNLAITWCKDYADAIEKIEGKRLLATTGVQTIGKLKPLEKKGMEVYYRILERESSLALARQQGAHPAQLCFYHQGEDELGLLTQLKPDAILLKESGETGGFSEKVWAAQEMNIRIYAIQRPETPQIFHRVNGEHGLRRAVEQLLPEFYPLHSGLTTGTCATAAAIADSIRLFKGEKPDEVPVILPNDETIMVPVDYQEDGAVVIKDSGDDPDVTKGMAICASVKQTEQSGIIIKGGRGVGTITLKGFDYPPGSPAINKVPRQMIERNLSVFHKNIEVTIFVPKGEEIAKRTFNPRLGIVGGISIVGVSGIIKPFSEEGFINSIRKCMDVAKATGCDRVVINSGAKSERYVKDYYSDLPPQVFIEYGNFIGETIRLAAMANIPHVSLGIMLGKAVKLAEGHLDTHSKKVVMNKDFIVSMVQEAGCNEDTIRKVNDITLARELWQIIPTENLNAFCRVLISHCHKHCSPLLPNGELTILLIDEGGTIHHD